MGLVAFLTINGKTQGDISKGAGSNESIGQAATPVHPDEISVFAVKGDFTIPRDTSTGLPTGRPNSLGFTITKPFDKSSPLLFQAWVTGEVLTVELHWFRPDPAGTQKPQWYFTHKFENVIIGNLIQYMPNVLAPENAYFAQLEGVLFVFRQVRMEHLISGTTSSYMFP